MPRYLKGGATIEMAYLAPTILLLVMSLIFVVFYYHDKNVMLGAAAETAIIGVQLDRQKNLQGDIDLEQVFMGRVEEKLILFGGFEVAASSEDKEVVIVVTANHSFMRLNIEQRALILQPERSIRYYRLIQSKLNQ